MSCRANQGAYRPNTVVDLNGIRDVSITNQCRGIIEYIPLNFSSAKRMLSAPSNPELVNGFQVQQDYYEKSNPISVSSQSILGFRAAEYSAERTQE
jgi:hypothetical protein